MLYSGLVSYAIVLANLCFSPPAYCPGNLVFNTQSLYICRCRGRMRLGCQECRSDVKSILKFNRSNDVSNSKWVSENSHSFIDQCCVGPNLTGRLTHAVWALTSLGGSVLPNSTLSGGGPPFRVFSETPRGFQPRALMSL